MGGLSGSTYRAQTELYNGTNWTEQNDLNTARFDVGGGGTSTAGLAYGGSIPGGKTQATEEWTGAGAPVGAWSTGGTMNTARRYFAGAGVGSSAAIGFGGTTAPGNNQVANTENYNGTNWTEVNDMVTARQDLSSASAGTQTASLAFGGYPHPSFGPGSRSITELWNGTNWTEVNDLNTGRRLGQGAGISTAALMFGGATAPAVTAVTETWNGTNWTEVNDMNLARQHMGGFGATNTAALGFGGESSYPPYDNETESWNGTNWTELNNLNVEKAYLGGFGEYTSGLCVGGILGPGSNTATVEDWNGVSWVEIADLSTARFSMGNSGLTPAGAVFGGGTPPATGATEEWNGSTNVTKTIDTD